MAIVAWWPWNLLKILLLAKICTMPDKFHQALAKVNPLRLQRLQWTRESLYLKKQAWHICQFGMVATTVSLSTSPQLTLGSIQIINYWPFWVSFYAKFEDFVFVLGLKTRHPLNDCIFKMTLIIPLMGEGFMGECTPPFTNFLTKCLTSFFKIRKIFFSSVLKIISDVFD